MGLLQMCKFNLDEFPLNRQAQLNFLSHFYLVTFLKHLGYIYHKCYLSWLLEIIMYQATKYNQIFYSLRKEMEFE